MTASRFGRGWRAVATAVGFLAVQATVALPVAAQNVAMVTDVSGRVTGQAPVTILSEIRAETRMQVEAGGRLVVIYLASGDEYTFAGPAQIQFRATEPQVVSGAKFQKKSNPLGKGSNVTIRPVSVAQAAFVMRSARPTARIKLLTLSGTRTLDAAPEFRWQEVDPGAKYRFDLTDDTGKSLYDAEVAGASLQLPPSLQLREGMSYTWEVSTRAPDGRRYVSAGDFSVATQELRAEAETLRPAAGAPVSERVTYAAWLVQVQLKDEARKYWRTLTIERPEDETLKALAAE